MPTTPTLPGSLHQPEANAVGNLATSARRGPTPPPIRPASKRRLCSRKEPVPSCLQRGGASVLLRVFRRQIRESPFFSCFDRLAVYDRDAWLRFPIGSKTNPAAQGVVKSVKRPIEAPPAVAGMNRGVIREVPRKVAPLAPSAYQIKNRVDDFTSVKFRRPSSRLPGKQRGDLSPLLVGQVRRVSSSHDGRGWRESPRLTLQT